MAELDGCLDNFFYFLSLLFFFPCFSYFFLGGLQNCGPGKESASGSEFLILAMDPPDRRSGASGILVEYYTISSTHCFALYTVILSQLRKYTSFV